MLSGFRTPRSNQGSFFIFSFTSFSSSALKIKREPPSSTKGPPIKIKPSATSRSINSACSSQNGCSRVPFDKSRFGPADEIITNVFFITGEPQALCSCFVLFLIQSTDNLHAHRVNHARGRKLVLARRSGSCRTRRVRYPIASARAFGGAPNAIRPPQLWPEASEPNRHARVSAPPVTHAVAGRLLYIFW
jgi:hypothetical protein